MSDGASCSMSERVMISCGTDGGRAVGALGEVLAVIAIGNIKVG